jgi:hypothetical protein
VEQYKSERRIIFDEAKKNVALLSAHILNKPNMFEVAWNNEDKELFH